MCSGLPTISCRTRPLKVLRLCCREGQPTTTPPPCPIFLRGDNRSKSGLYDRWYLVPERDWSHDYWVLRVQVLLSSQGKPVDTGLLRGINWKGCSDGGRGTSVGQLESIVITEVKLKNNHGYGTEYKINVTEVGDLYSWTSNLLYRLSSKNSKTSDRIRVKSYTQSFIQLFICN